MSCTNDGLESSINGDRGDRPVVFVRGAHFANPGEQPALSALMPRSRSRLDSRRSLPARTSSSLTHITVTRTWSICSAHGSISAAGRSLHMSYHHTWLLVNALNAMFREPLLRTQLGGTGGGGAQVMALGHGVVKNFRAMESALRDCAAPPARSARGGCCETLSRTRAAFLRPRAKAPLFRVRTSNRVVGTED